MPYTKTEIANLALSHFGASPIDNLDDDPSEAGDACRVFFPVALETFLEAWDWPWARKTATLGLVPTNPSTEFEYAYRLPSDCRAPHRILSGQLIDHEDSQVPFRLGSDADGPLLFTDKEKAELEYTFLPTNVSGLTSKAALALSYKLAELLAGRVVREDPSGIAQKMERKYLMALDEAKAAALRSEKLPNPPDPKWLRSRR